MLPAGLLYSRDETCGSHLTELDTRKTELTHVTLWTSSNLAAVVQADRVGVAWNALELACCLVCISRILGSCDNLLQCGTLLSIAGNKFGALYFAGLH